MPVISPPRIIHALTSHRFLFAAAGAHWAAGFALVPFLDEYAVAILLAAATLTVLARQQLITRQRLSYMEGWRENLQALTSTQAKLVDAVAAYAEITAQGRRSDTGSHLILPGAPGARPVQLHAVEDGRSEPA